MPVKDFLLSNLSTAEEAIQENRWDDAIEAMDTAYAIIRKIQDQQARNAEKKRGGH